MQLDAWGASHVGPRSHNEDAVLVDGELRLFIVADGTGGRSAGDVAARMLIDVTRRRMGALYGPRGSEAGPLSTDRVVAELPNALSEANQAIHSLRHAERTYAGMATTGLVLQFSDSRAVVGHVGDCRVYLIRGQRIYQLTEDHTVMQEALSLGKMPVDRAKKLRFANMLTHSLGSAPAVESDVLSVEIFPGDRFVMCSDGLSDFVESDEILALCQGRSPEDAVRQLIAQAESQGSRDNITVIAIDVRDVQISLDALPTQQKASVLRNVFLFQDLSFQQLIRVLSVVRELRFAHGEVIVSEGTLGSDLFVVVVGEATVTQGGAHLANIPAGGHFGELGLVSDGARSATVTAIGEVVALAISRQDFYQLVADDHTLAVKLMWRFLANMAELVRTLTDTIGRKSQS